MIQWHLFFVSSSGSLSSPRNSRVTASWGSSRSRDRWSFWFSCFSSSLASRYSKYTRCVLEVLCLRRKVHGAKFLGETSVLLYAGTTEDISCNWYAAISFLHGQCYPFLGGAISVLHIYCRDSALISSVVIIVALARDCFVYIWVIRRRRSYLAASRLPRTIYAAQILFRPPEDCSAKRIADCFGKHCIHQTSRSRHGIARPHFFRFPLPR